MATAKPKPKKEKQYTEIWKEKGMCYMHSGDLTSRISEKYYKLKKSDGAYVRRVK